MSVIAEIEFSPQSFELGRILRIEADTRVELDSMVPIGESIVPLIWVFNHHLDAFEESVKKHPSVDSFEVQEVHDDRTLYQLEWNASRDIVLEGIHEMGAQLLGATGSESVWRFELRFPDHDELSAFQEYCQNAGVTFELKRVYNPTKPELGPWYGLSEPQREALELAKRTGYFEIPRQISTKHLGEELGISDQAVTERMRRGLSRLLEHTLMVDDESEE